MEINFENYKGIEFVRISSLPEDQKRMIWNSVDSQKIIKILRDDELLNDCLQYDDYQEWYKLRYRAAMNQAESAQPLQSKSLKLAFE